MPRADAMPWKRAPTDTRGFAPRTRRSRPDARRMRAGQANGDAWSRARLASTRSTRPRSSRESKSRSDTSRRSVRLCCALQPIRRAGSHAWHSERRLQRPVPISCREPAGVVQMQMRQNDYIHVGGRYSAFLKSVHQRRARDKVVVARFLSVSLSPMPASTSIVCPSPRRRRQFNPI